MTVLAVDLALLRDVLLPGLRLTPGRAMMARVIEAPPQGAGRGTLAIAGYALTAELPAGVRAGQQLRLEVRDVTATRVLLQVSPAAAGPPPPPPAPSATVALPGGLTLRIADEDEGSAGGGGAGDRRSLALRLDGPGLGPVDLRFALDPASLRVGISVAPGEPLRRAEAALGELRAALAPAGEGRQVAVTVVPRREPLDLLA
jgi:hypothetical protein